MTTYLVTVGESTTIAEDDPERALEAVLATLTQKLQAGGEVTFTASVVESPSYGVTHPVFSGREVKVSLPQSILVPVTIHKKPRAKRTSRKK